MAVRSLGKVVVTSAGTPVRTTLNQSIPATRVPVQSIFVQQIAGNTGKIYIGSSGLVAATFANVFAVLPIPTTNALPSWQATIVESSNGLNAADIYIDAEVGGEGAVVSVTEQ